MTQLPATSTLNVLTSHDHFRSGFQGEGQYQLSMVPKSTTHRRVMSPMQVDKHSGLITQQQMLGAVVNDSSAAVRTSASSATRLNAALSNNLPSGNILSPRVTRNTKSFAMNNGKPVPMTGHRPVSSINQGLISNFSGDAMPATAASNLQAQQMAKPRRPTAKIRSSSFYPVQGKLKPTFFGK